MDGKGVTSRRVGVFGVGLICDHIVNGTAFELIAKCYCKLSCDRNSDNGKRVAWDGPRFPRAELSIA